MIPSYYGNSGIFRTYNMIRYEQHSKRICYLRNNQYGNMIKIINKHGPSGSILLIKCMRYYGNENVVHVWDEF